jgi:hypothetical protein
MFMPCNFIMWTPESPFEFRALEVTLEAICSFLDARTTELETDAYPALDELTSKVSELMFTILNSPVWTWLSPPKNILYVIFLKWYVVCYSLRPKLIAWTQARYAVSRYINLGQREYVNYGSWKMSFHPVFRIEKKDNGWVSIAATSFIWLLNVVV